jgi:putative transcriptional regulator
VKDELFGQLVASLTEGGAVLRGEQPGSRRFVIDGPDVKSIRTRYNMPQARFAALMGISVATLRNWEQGRRTPDGPARILLLVAERHPEAILDSVRSLNESRSARLIEQSVAVGA